MAAISSVMTDDTTLSRLDRVWLRLEAFLNLISGITIFLLVLLAVVHVVSRKLLNAPVPGYVDWTQQFMAVFAFLGVAYCQREGGHIRMDIVIGSLRGRMLWLAEWLSILFMLIVTTGLIYGTYFHFERSFDVTKPLWSNDSSIDISLPLWPAKFLVPFALSVLWVRLVLQLWGYGRALRHGQTHPVGVPLIETAAEQAMREAEQTRAANK